MTSHTFSMRSLHRSADLDRAVGIQSPWGRRDGVRLWQLSHHDKVAIRRQFHAWIWISRALKMTALLSILAGLHFLGWERVQSCVGFLNACQMAAKNPDWGGKQESYLRDTLVGKAIEESQIWNFHHNASIIDFAINGWRHSCISLVDSALSNWTQIDVCNWWPHYEFLAFKFSLIWIPDIPYFFE